MRELAGHGLAGWIERRLGGAHRLAQHGNRVDR
jgi:hypothetical protein